MRVFPLLYAEKEIGVILDVAIVVGYTEMRSRTRFEVRDGNSGIRALTFHLFYNIHGKSLWHNENVIKPTVGLVSRTRCCCIHEILYTRDVN